MSDREIPPRVYPRHRPMRSFAVVAGLAALTLCAMWWFR